MDSAIISPDQLTALYRFTLLLTGSVATAEGIVLEVLAEVSGQAAQIRSVKSRQALLITKIRGRCMQTAAANVEKEGGNVEAADTPPDLIPFAKKFSGLDEPGRSALALLYVDLLSVPETAALLHISLEELGDALHAARNGLGGFGAASRSEPAGAVESDS